MRDLKSLSREQKLELIEAAREKKIRKRAQRAHYTPNSGQMPVHQCTKKVRFVAASNAGGKTCLAVQEAVWSCLGFNPITEKYTKVPVRSIVVLDRPDKVRDVWLQEAEKWFDTSKWELHKDGKPFISRISFPNGSELHFLFHQTDPMAFESIEVQGIVVFDEPPPRHVWVGLYRGGRTKGHQPRYLIIGTPIGATWLRRDLWDPWSRGELPDTECFRFDIEVNRKNLADGYIESFSKILTEQEKNVRLRGLFSDLEGLALAHLFDRKVHLIPPFEWNIDWPCIVAIDPHPSKNHIACLVGVDRDGFIYYLKELSSDLAPTQFARQLRTFYQGYRISTIICDSLGATPGTGGDGNKSFIDVLRENGVQARSTTFQEKDDENFIQNIQQVLELPDKADNFGRRLPKLRIFQGNKGIITDVENVEWTKYRNMDEFKPKLNITNKDYLACLKYALSTNVSAINTKQRVVKPKNPSPWGAPKKMRFFR